MIYLILLLITNVSGAKAGCTRMEGPKAFKCIQHLNEIRELAYSINIYEKESAEKSTKPCNAFHKCYEELKCGVEDGVTELIDKISDYCNAVAFHHTKEFDDCDMKLGGLNSTCVEEWDPFPVPVPNQAQAEEMQKEACKNFFGKDNCLEKELTNNCGLEMWTQFRKHYLALNKINEACDFS